jgi:enamine deaminase RidA (YjgF/YER057c/UK114 family)
VERRFIVGESPWEAVYGYSRAVVAGRTVHVSGTAPVMPDGAEPPADARGQALRCLELIMNALAQVGAGPEHVVRTRLYLTRGDAIDEVGRAHREVFGETRPATTAVVVAGLLDPRWLVEIEADAVLD